MRTVMILGSALLVCSVVPLSCMCQTLVFPHVADGLNGDGTRWATEIDIVNASDTTQSITLSFFNPNGSPRCFNIGPPPASYGCPISLSLAPNAMKPIIIDSAFNALVPVRTVWALLQGTGGIQAILIFRRIEGFWDGKVISEAAFVAAAPSAKIGFFSKVSELAAGGTSTTVPAIAYAIANPDPTFTTLGEIQLVDGTTHEVISRASLSLAPHCQTSGFLDQAFGLPATSGPYYARIALQQGAVSAIGLRFTNTSIAAIPPQ